MELIEHNNSVMEKLRRAREEESLRRYHRQSLMTLSRVEKDCPALRELHLGSTDFNDSGRAVGPFLSHDDATLASLGRAIGSNTHLETFQYYESSLIRMTKDFGVTVAKNRLFFDGLRHNESIHKLEIVGCDLSHGIGRELLTAFQENANNIKRTAINDCRLRNGGVDVLASFLKRCKNITQISIISCKNDNNLMGKLASAIKDLQSLKKLNLIENCDNETSDCCATPLATLLQDPNCNICELGIKESGMNDDCLTILADALRNNTKLERLWFAYRNRVTARGWGVFSNVLCDTSSINCTYSSNHTLKRLEETQIRKNNGNFLLEAPHINERSLNKKQAAINKILRWHPQLDMKPFFEWNIKMLPFVVEWFGRAEASCMQRSETTRKNVHLRKLNAVYQFIHTFPGALQETEKGDCKMEAKASKV